MIGSHKSLSTSTTTPSYFSLSLSLNFLHLSVKKQSNLSKSIQDVLFKISSLTLNGAHTPERNLKKITLESKI